MPIDYSKCPTKDELSFVKGAIGNIQQQIDDLSGGGGGGVTTGNLTESTSSVLNIVGGTNAVVGSGTSIQVKQASATLNGYLSSTDWNTFNSKEPALAKGNLTESVSSVLTISGGTNAVIGSGTSIQVKQASGSQGGFLASTDFNTFNNKQDALSSGVNIKTINSNSLVGSGNVAVQDVLVSGTNIKTINTNSLLGAGNISVQDTLVSGTNIKTINSSSLLGSGDVSVQPTLVSGTNIKTINSGSILGSGDLLLQDKLVSGTNIKTINSTSLLGSGDLPVQDVLVSGTNIKTIDGISLLGSGNVITGTYQKILSSLGSTIKATTFPFDQGAWGFITNSLALTNQQLVFLPLYLQQSLLLTGIKIHCPNTGNYTGNNYNGVGLYTYSGGTLTLVASTTNDPNFWKPTANVVTNKPFSTPYNANAGMYYLGALYCQSAQTTAPTLLNVAMGSTTTGSLDFTNSAKIFGQVAGVTSLPSTQLMSGVTARGNGNMMFVY